jgi:hypothetical protein
MWLDYEDPRLAIIRHNTLTDKTVQEALEHFKEEFQAHEIRSCTQYNEQLHHARCADMVRDQWLARASFDAARAPVLSHARTLFSDTAALAAAVASRGHRSYAVVACMQLEHRTLATGIKGQKRAERVAALDTLMKHVQLQALIDELEQAHFATNAGDGSISSPVVMDALAAPTTPTADSQEVSTMTATPPPAGSEREVQSPCPHSDDADETRVRIPTPASLPSRDARTESPLSSDCSDSDDGDNHSVDASDDDTSEEFINPKARDMCHLFQQAQQVSVQQLDELVSKAWFSNDQVTTLIGKVYYVVRRRYVAPQLCMYYNINTCNMDPCKRLHMCCICQCEDDVHAAKDCPYLPLLGMYARIY